MIRMMMVAAMVAALGRCVSAYVAPLAEIADDPADRFDPEQCYE